MVTKYYSEILKKSFDTEAECLEAEKLEEERLEKEKEKREAKKARAEEVEDAFKHVDDVTEEAYTMISEARMAANKLLDEFVKDYGSFHYSYTSTEKESKPLVGWGFWF